MRIYAGRTTPYCDGMRRRSFVQLGVAGMASLGMGRLLQAKEQSAATSREKKATSAILIWLDGGPGHMDMYDMKPDAPVEYRGLWRPISTKVPGFDITELFPKQAKVTDVAINAAGSVPGATYLITDTSPLWPGRELARIDIPDSDLVTNAKDDLIMNLQLLFSRLSLSF